MNTHIMYLDRNLSTIQEYLHNTHREKLKSVWSHSHTCNDGPVNYSLQFIYYNTT